MAANSREILSELEKSDANKVEVVICDVDGVLRGKVIHKDKFLATVDGGLGFCDVLLGWDCDDASYDNVAYTGWHTGYPDARVRADLSTHRRVPWENGLDFFLCDFETPAGDPLGVCPRQGLKRVVNRLRDAGYEAHAGFEIEWFNFNETPQSLADKNYTGMQPLTPGMFGYSPLRAGLKHSFFHALMDGLAEFGVPLEAIHTETGPGAYEACIMHSGALEAADRAALFKFGVKEIAYAHGIIASFMARWNASLPGSGGHIHESLTSLDSGKSLFFDPDRPGEMTPIFRSFLAGQMHCLPELLPFFAPTVNSYKRLVDGYWAPTTVTWGIDNRTVCFRVLLGSAKAARLECRAPGADLNPYLALAASLASGLYGIERKMELDQPGVAGNAYGNTGARRLAPNLMEATEALAGSSLAKDLLGAELVDHFVNSRLWEWRRFEQAVTDWELKRYFELI